VPVPGLRPAATYPESDLQSESRAYMGICRVLSRKHVVAIAAVITVVMLTLTAWHRQSSNDPAGAESTSGRATGSPVASSTAPTGRASSAATGASSRPSRTVSIPSATAKPSATAAPRLTVQQLSRNLSSLLGAGDSFSVAALDLTTGRTVTAGASSGMTEASEIKLDILETALYRQQTGQSSFDDDDVADMMERSDNAAADRVFVDDGGNSGLQQYNDKVGLRHTQLDPTSTWGLSTTAATDQLTLLKQLVSSKSVLTAASRGYALNLMGQVESDQQWGISAAADRGASSQLKNGWLNIDRDNGLWAVNSAGLTTAGGHKVLLVVLSQHQPDFQTGVNRVEAAARQLAAALLAR
jgi:Beta-lactamase enzyme family